MSSEFIAHVRASDGDKQSLQAHLEGVAELSRKFAAKNGLEKAGELIGLLHDLGKYSDEFQNYLKSATGLLNQDEDEEFVDAKGLKGKVDHSTAGAQLIWKELSKKKDLEQIVGQVLALCVASHHSGLIDCLTSKPSEPTADGFTRRMNKPGEKTHLGEALSKSDKMIIERFHSLINDKELTIGLKSAIATIIQNSPEETDKCVVAQFQIGLLVRFLFSCLIDADRTNTADYEKPRKASHRLDGKYVNWKELIRRLENHLSIFSDASGINELRNDISRHCLDAASKSKGVFTLTVPTGGGKTLAGLRFALHHAQIHGMERIINVIPFTSIIDQNAKRVREILEPENHPEDKGGVVLEHHSNITPAEQGWRAKMLTENWDAPVVYTTSVQFLEAMFGAGTRGARRMHQLANSVIIFDEVQSIPVQCVHLFNNAINFLAEQCGSSIVLCTATQPLLNRVDAKLGAVKFSENSEIMPDVGKLFEALQRVHILDETKPEGWSDQEIADLAVQELQDSGSCLVIVNTKRAAQKLYQRLEVEKTFHLYHLSTSMCPVHRKEALEEIKGHLERKESMLCISTQLIEAGVDVDFGAVIRFAAGLDSIAQAAGRCNRNGLRETGRVHVVNPADENLGPLDDIRIGKEKTARVMTDFRENPAKYGDSLIGPQAMDWYYENYFFARKDEMAYKVKPNRIGREDTLLNLLSVNSRAVGDYGRIHAKAPDIYLRQSFMAAGKAFQAIDAPTQGVIVQYKGGRDLVTALCAAHEVEKQFELLRQAQQYTVNLFPHEFQKLMGQNALREVQAGTEIYYLDDRYYSKEFGFSTELVAEGRFPSHV